jgi:protein SCO1/2
VVKRNVVFAAAFAAALFLVFSSTPLRRLAGFSAGPPVLGDAPVFALFGDDGRAFDSHSLDGRPWLASFLFTSCPGPCPKLVEKMKGLRLRLPAADLAFVSFSVDPGTDTPEVLTAYKRKHGIADTDGWTFATGPTDDVLRLVEHGFLTGVERSDSDSGDGGITHGTRVVLVDAHRHIRGFYATDRDEDVERLVRDVAALD